MSYQWSYLWASVDIDLTGWHRRDHLGPTTLTWLADEAAARLRRDERFTIHFSRGNPKNDPRAFHCRAQNLAETLLDSLHLRHPGLRFHERFRVIGRASVALQVIPLQEWHPEFRQATGKPWIVHCDASWRDPENVRAGITGGKGSCANASINLAPASPRTSSQAEFLGICLAMLTGVHKRVPIVVMCDSSNAVTEARTLGKGIMPSWMYREGSELAQRLAIAATTSMRLRPVITKQVSRTKTLRADKAAEYDGPETDVLHIRTWSKTQGMPLSWYDKDRGLVRP